MQNKILLVYEDFNELTSLELSLKKIGFDVVGLSTEYSLQDKMLSFNPDVVIASGRGPKVSTISVGKKLKEMTRWQGKSLLVFSAGFKPNPQDLIKARMDLILEAPIALTRMIQILAKFTGLSEQTLLDKLNKATMTEADPSKPQSGSSSSAKSQESVFVQGGEAEKEESRMASGYIEENEDQKIKGGDHFPLEKNKSFQKVDPFEQMKSELGAGKAKFKFDLDNPFSSPKDGKNESKKMDFNKNSESASHDSSVSGGKSESEKATSVSEQADAVQAKPFQKELEMVRKNSAARQKHYDEQLQGVAQLPIKSTLSDRRAIRKAHKELLKDWNVTDLEEQDRLRREFTTAIFKKTR